MTLESIDAISGTYCLLDVITFSLAAFQSEYVSAVGFFAVEKHLCFASLPSISAPLAPQPSFYFLVKD